MARLLFAVLLIGAAFYPQQKTTAEPVISRPVVFVITEAPKLRGQAIAQSRADYMARRGYRGHPPKSSGNQWSIPGANFEGVGWRSNQQTPHKSVGTCVANRRHTDQSALAGRLVAQVHLMTIAGSCSVTLFHVRLMVRSA